MNKKKPYNAPEITKVKLSIGNSILAVCHSSPNNTPQTITGGCMYSRGCYAGPGTDPLPG